MRYLPSQDNMKPVFATISLFILALVVSCSPAKNDSQQTPQVPVLPQNQEQPNVVDPEAPATETSEATNPVASEENNSQVTINPPHGEPGHRCEIPVGAPLNSQPTNTTQQVTGNPSPSTNNAGVMINPPHGEPGHRCEIPVGAPLNSQPTNTTPQVTSIPSPSTNSATNLANNPMAPTIDNAKRLNSTQPRSTTTTQNSGRINPPHGQPGHRCDIPVGSPLP